MHPSFRGNAKHRTSDARLRIGERRCGKQESPESAESHSNHYVGNAGCFRSLRCEYSCAYQDCPARTRLRVHWRRLRREIAKPYVKAAPFECCAARNWNLRRVDGGRACVTLGCRHPRMRVIQYPRDVGDGAERPRRTGSPACAGDDDLPPADVMRHRPTSITRPTAYSAAAAKRLLSSSASSRAFSAVAFLMFSSLT